MVNLSKNPFELLFVIVNDGLGSKVLSKAKEKGITGGTILYGKGTVSNPILNFFSLYDEKKEIVLMGSNHQIADDVIHHLDKVFHFKKPNHGIAFSIHTCDILGSRCNLRDEATEIGGHQTLMYQFIITIVNRGKAEDVIDAAKEAGSKGGTIINARGSGIHETSKLFNMEIEPEKEIVMILSKVETVDHIVSNIVKKLDLDEPGNGIIFVQDVHHAYGVHD